MAIRTVVTRGFGNGTYNGTIPLVVPRGYAAGEALAATDEGGAWYPVVKASRGVK